MNIYIIIASFVALTSAVICNASDNARGIKVVYGESRTALVIGNSTYASNPLINPMNDAEDVASLLRQRKFNVRLLVNADKKAMDAAVEEFGQLLEQGGVGLFYYAGHAVQIGGVNYLLPVDAQIRKAHDLKYQGVNVQQVLSEMDSSRNRLNVAILDACRDNPYPSLSRSLGGGLAKVDAPRGSLIAYATAPGRTAADGDGRNGIFTKHFLDQAAIPGKEMLDMFREVTAGVAHDTKEQQDPWIHQSVRGKFYFTPIDFIDQKLELTAAELARYKKLMDEQQAADEQMKRLESEKNTAIGKMEQEIAELRSKMNQPGSSSSLDQLVAMARQREQYQDDLEAAKTKAEQDRLLRESEIAKLKAQELANRKKKFEDEYKKYRFIVDSKYMLSADKEKAWVLICQAWNVLDTSDTPGWLFWDDKSGSVTTNNFSSGKVASDIHINTINTIASESLTNGLLLHYSFDSDEGTKVTDKSGELHHGKMYGGQWVAYGKVGGAYNFVNDYISAGDVDALELKDKSMSYSAWFKTINHGNRMILSKQSTERPYRGYNLFVGYGGKVCLEAYEAWPSLGLHLTTPEAIYADGEWHHAAVVFDREKQIVSIFVDGIKKANDSIASFGSSDAEKGVPFQVGRRGTRYSEFFIGSIDEVMIWNHALSEETIKDLYNKQQ